MAGDNLLHFFGNVPLSIQDSLYGHTYFFHGVALGQVSVGAGIQKLQRDGVLLIAYINKYVHNRLCTPLDWDHWLAGIIDSLLGEFRIIFNFQTKVQWSNHL